MDAARQRTLGGQGSVVRGPEVAVSSRGRARRVRLRGSIDFAAHARVGLLPPATLAGEDWAMMIDKVDSPYLLDHLRPEEVRLTTLRDDGAAVCGCLEEHPDFDKGKESMTPGEFWSLVGEKWLLETKGAETTR